MTVRFETQDARRRRAAVEIADGVRALRETNAPESKPPEGIEVRPANAYEAVTRQMVDALQEDLREIKGRLNALLFALVGGVAIDVIARVLAR